MQSEPYFVLEEMERRGHEQVIFCRDPGSGLRAIIGIHSTELGPALGGCRMYPYASERDALVDVLRLSRGMTFKAAVTGLNLGGGKCVVIGDPRSHKSELLWRALGRSIEGLAGRYITAEDSGTTTFDMEQIRTETRYVVGTERNLGGSGDPSPVTALGVFSGMRAAIEERLGTDAFAGLRVAVQGCGSVGYHLVGHLVRAGAQVTVADIDAEAVRRAVHDFRVQEVPADAIYDVPCDIFSPCALGGSLNARTIPRLNCRVVAGAANNQLADEVEDGAALGAREILYAPDFVLNAGGLINVANELQGYVPERALGQAKRSIYEVLQAVFARARADRVATYAAANLLATQRIQAVRDVRRTYLRPGAAPWSSQKQET